MSIYQSIKEVPVKESGFQEELIPLLALLEGCNPCNQTYEISGDCMVVSYFLRLNLLNFLKRFKLRMKVEIIGLPISLSEKGYWGPEALVEQLIQKRRGIKILLNGNPGFTGGGRTLSTFVFDNAFSSFEEYLNALRSPYRRRVKKALSKGENLLVRGFDRQAFSETHYRLYLSIMARTENPLEVLPLEFFREYEAEFLEFIDKKTGGVIGFVQLKTMNHRLHFLFGGFEKQENEGRELYTNMLLAILKTGIDRKVKVIEFGQTAEASKLKLGCREVPKYMMVHHSNSFLNRIIQGLLPLLTYKPYPIQHHVFKGNPRAGIGEKNDHFFS